ncbi:RNase adapter RapZ [Methylotenera versatilis]|uniref:RNase adapter RapZ n=1 Tax=Methylotenera versatilis TaxID=1055487 RepID=UPI00064863EB|nr:RNase adapter RapZ [Methylotenera versatilis]
MQIIIVTGLSGSGKSIVLRALEDSSFYCIDNLPATLLPQISQHLNATNHSKIAISIDSRSAALEALPKAIESLKSAGNQVQVWFLESAVETLVKRFSETRRKHPLSNESTTLPESIANERELLAGVAELGHHIDTSNLSANALRNHIRDLLKQDNYNAGDASNRGLVLLFTSFGFKNGIPLDADFVFDVRSLPNPHYDADLKPLTGKDAAVQMFLAKQPAVVEMLADIQHYVEKWLPSFNQDHRSYLTVAIGCTGGQHRSVYFVEQLSSYFKQQKQQVIIRHRELD